VIQIIYFGLAGAAYATAISLLLTKLVLKPKRARRDRGAHLTFAIFMFVAGSFALLLGFVAA
jgi:hypothetical protein